jgi:hypothetical protein
MPLWLRRLFGRGELRRGPCYPALRASAERHYGDLSLRGETEMDGRWPVPGAPFDEPQQEARRCVAR